MDAMRERRTAVEEARRSDVWSRAARAAFPIIILCSAHRDVELMETISQSSTSLSWVVRRKSPDGPQDVVAAIVAHDLGRRSLLEIASTIGLWSLMLRAQSSPAGVMTSPRSGRCAKAHGGCDTNQPSRWQRVREAVLKWVGSAVMTHVSFFVASVH